MAFVREQAVVQITVKYRYYHYLSYLRRTAMTTRRGTLARIYKLGTGQWNIEKSEGKSHTALEDKTTATSFALLLITDQLYSSSIQFGGCSPPEFDQRSFCSLGKCCAKTNSTHFDGRTMALPTNSESSSA